MARITLDNELEADDGEVLTAREFRRMLRRVGDNLSGRVLEAGLGLGLARRSIWRARGVRRLHTVEIRGDVVDLWRQRKGEVNSPFDDSPEDADNTVEVEDIRVVLDREAARATKRFRAGMFDIPNEILQEPDVVANLKALFPEPLQRVVVCRWNDDDLTLPGFICRRLHAPDLNPNLIWICDRWEPEAGVGVDPHAGKILKPGAGWVTID